MGKMRTLFSSCMSYDKFDKSDLHHKIPGKGEIPHENLTELKLVLYKTTITEQTKVLRTKKF